MVILFLAVIGLLLWVARLHMRLSNLETRDAAHTDTEASLRARVADLARAQKQATAVSPSPVATTPVVAPPLPSRASVTPPRPIPPPPVRTAEPVLKPAPASPPSKPFDWEELIGVRLFSWAAGIMLAGTAIFFLGYGIQQGWLQPPVRLAIGIVVGLGLLVGCELKSARRYPVTANALDGSAIVILFSSFYAAYRLWHLTGPLAAFALLAAVAVTAVALSIRRDSVFIALLGLVGGFATPALLATGQDDPPSLFGYLLLLNAGLGWVAYRKRWPVLSALSLLFTTVYQWGWVATFMRPGRVPTAAAIFLAFPLLAVVTLGLAGRAGLLATSADAREKRNWFEEVAGVSAALPLLFALYLATSQAYGDSPALMFGFLFVVDAGLFAVALWRGRPWLHGLGALTTVVVAAAWATSTYGNGATHAAAYTTVLAFVGLFVAFFLATGLTARHGSLRLDGPGRQAVYAAPLLLFLFPAFAASETAAAAPALPFATLLVLLAACAAFAVVEREGLVYFIASFLAVAAEATWSARSLTPDRLVGALVVYAAFGLLFLAVPVVARRRRTPLEPAWIGTGLLLVSMVLLVFLSGESVAPSSLWGLAILIGLLNLAVMVETRGGGRRIFVLAGGVISWLVLARWWFSGALTAQLVPAVAVVTGFALLTLSGHLWSAGGQAESASDDTQSGLALALVGHAFLISVALQPSLALPPWPMLGALFVLDAAIAAAALYARRAELLAGALGLSQVVLVVWEATSAVPPWPTVAMAAGTLVGAIGVVVLALSSRRVAEPDWRDGFFAAAVAPLLLGQVLLIVAAGCKGSPNAAALAGFHVLFIACLLALAAVRGWQLVGVAACAIASVATLLYADSPATWQQALLLATPIYLAFMANPLALGRRVGRDLYPHLAAVIASASFFQVARVSLTTGGFGRVIGLLPVAQAGLVGVLLAALLKLEPPTDRTLGRLAMVAAAVLALVTVAIPLQLDKAWLTVGWALEGAALAWLFRRIPHRGLFWWGVALLAAVFVRLVFNPEVLVYQTRSEVRIFNWYLYTYLACAGAMYAASWLFLKVRDEMAGWLTGSRLAAVGGTILLFVLLNIEIADYFATGDTIAFKLSAGLAQNLTYTLGWAIFAVSLLTGGILLRSHEARLSAILLLTVALLKGFLSDVSRLPGLYRVMSFAGLAVCLALVAVMLQRFVLAPAKRAERDLS